MNKWNIIKWVLTVIIIGLLFWKLDVSAIYDTLINMNYWYLLPIIFFAWFGLIFGCVDFFFLLRVMKHNVKYISILKYSSIAWALGLVLPGRLGDFSMIYLFTKEGVSYGEGSAVFILSRALTMLSLAIIFSVGVIWFFPIYTLIVTLIVFWGLIMIGSVLVFTERGWSLFSKLIPNKYKDKFSLYYSSIKLFMSQKKWSLLVVFVIVFLQRMLNGVFFYYILISLGQNVSFIIPLVINAVEIIVGLIPITIGGLGIKEGVGASLYSSQGIALNVIGAMYALSIFFTYLTGAIVILLWGDRFGKKAVQV